MDDHARESEERDLFSAQAGDFEAFRRIVLQYANALLSVAYGVVGDFHEAQDVVQEASVKAHRRLHTLHDPSKLGSWLYAIAYRTSLDFVKKRKRAAPLNEAASPALDNVEEWLERSEMQEAVRRAVEGLDRTSRAALVLRYASEWPMKEIGRFLGLSVSAADSRIRRAKETLKRELAFDYEPYFRRQRLDRAFEREVSALVLRRMGHFYIPVVHRERTRDWFVRYFRLGISRHGNPLLASGQELYLLECPAVPPSELPLLAFAVPDIVGLWSKLKADGVRSEPIARSEWFGEHFAFFDPDGNRYHAVRSAE